MITEGLLRCKSGPDEVEPEDDLTELNVGRVSEADDNDADAVGITDEQVVGHVVRLVAGELPDAYLTDAWTALHTDSEKPRKRFPSHTHQQSMTGLVNLDNFTRSFCSHVHKK